KLDGPRYVGGWHCDLIKVHGLTSTPTSARRGAFAPRGTRARICVGRAVRWLHAHSLRRLRFPRRSFRNTSAVATTATQAAWNKMRPSHVGVRSSKYVGCPSVICPVNLK